MTAVIEKGTPAGSAPPRAVKGTRDLLPPETAVWNHVEQVARRVFERYGYGEIRTPMLEDTALFVRGVGTDSDIVNKEMYVFADKSGRSLCLRPEATAAVARSYIQHRLADRPAPLKLYYIGPMFRYERPQKGRYRQFFQIGAEVLGGDAPEIDAELLILLFDFLAALGFRDLTLLVNSVGCEHCRPAYVAYLRQELSGPAGAALCSDCQSRLQANPLRLFDCKVPEDRAATAALQPMAAFLCAACAEHHQRLGTLLARFGLPHRAAPELVRGLDYYTRTVFEVVAAGLGAQDAILGGGRYDRLIADLGGARTPGIGFAIGLDRLIEVLPDGSAGKGSRITAYVVPVGAAACERALEVAHDLRNAGIATEVELGGRSLKAALKRADREAYGHAILVGEDEMASGRLTWRNLASGEQRQVALAELRQELAALESSEATSKGLANPC